MDNDYKGSKEQEEICKIVCSDKESITDHLQIAVNGKLDNIIELLKT